MGKTKESTKTQERVWTKVEKFPRLIEWEEEPSIIGIPLKISQGKTTYGDAEFLHLETPDGEIVSIALGSTLAGYPWADYFGQEIMINYTGTEPSKNHKNKTFKTFDVFYR